MVCFPGIQKWASPTYIKSVKSIPNPSLPSLTINYINWIRSCLFPLQSLPEGEPVVVSALQPQRSRSDTVVVVVEKSLRWRTEYKARSCEECTRGGKLRLISWINEGFCMEKHNSFLLSLPLQWHDSQRQHQRHSAINFTLFLLLSPLIVSRL